MKTNKVKTSELEQILLILKALTQDKPQDTKSGFGEFGFDCSLEIPPVSRWGTSTGSLENCVEVHLATIAHVAFHLATIGQVAFLPSKNSQSTGWSIGGSLCRNASSSFQVAKVLEQFVQSTLLLLPGKLTAGNECVFYPMKPREIHFLKSGGDPVYFHPCLCKEADFSVNQVSQY